MFLSIVKGVGICFLGLVMLVMIMYAMNEDEIEYEQRKLQRETRRKNRKQ